MRTWQVPCPAGQDGGISSYCGRINAGSYDRIPARYRQIFQGRPGFPALAAPWVALLGPPGMIVAMFIALAGFCAALAWGVTVLGGNRSAALVTVAAAMLTPIGFWATRILPEGAVLAGIALSASARRWFSEELGPSSAWRLPSRGCGRRWR